jgi:hypothetical protein
VGHDQAQHQPALSHVQTEMIGNLEAFLKIGSCRSRWRY